MSAMELKVQGMSTVLASASALAGFAAPWPHVVAGLFFAVSGGFVGMAVSPSGERLALPMTVAVALVIGLFAGMMHPNFHALGPLFGWIAALPVQLVMGVAGLASPWLARRAAAGDIRAPWKGSNQ